MKDKILILDIESTGISNTDQIIELAYIICPTTIREWVADYAKYQQVSGFVEYTERFKPSVPINPHAFKVHGISMLKLLNCRPSREAKVPADTKYIVGHNVAVFDHRLLGKPDVLCIDTMVLVRTLRKLGLITNNYDEGKDKLDVLITHYFPEVAKTLIKPLHSALDDCHKVILLLSVILEKFPNVTTWDTLHALQTLGKKK